MTCVPKFIIPQVLSSQSLLQVQGMCIHPVFQGHNCDRQSQTLFFTWIFKETCFQPPHHLLFSEIAVIPNSRNFLALLSGKQLILIFFMANFVSSFFLFGQLITTCPLTFNVQNWIPISPLLFYLFLIVLSSEFLLF